MEGTSWGGGFVALDYGWSLDRARENSLHLMVHPSFHKQFSSFSFFTSWCSVSGIMPCKDKQWKTELAHPRGCYSLVPESGVSQMVRLVRVGASVMQKRMQTACDLKTCSGLESKEAFLTKWHFLETRGESRK